MAMRSDGAYLIVNTQGLTGVVDARQYGPVTTLPYAFGAEFTANTVWLLEEDGYMDFHHPEDGMKSVV